MRIGAGGAIRSGCEHVFAYQLKRVERVQIQFRERRRAAVSERGRGDRVQRD